MMKHLILSLLASSFIIFNSFSQPTKFSGIVLDKNTQKTIPFVHFASILNQGVGFISSEKGSYNFQLDIEKKDTFSISVIGYKSRKISVTKLIKIDTIFLESKHIELHEFTVRAKKKTPLEIFEEALENFNKKEYKKQNFTANYNELCIYEKKDTSFLRSNCLIANYTPKEKSGFIFKKKFLEKVAILDIDSIQNKIPKSSPINIKNHLLLMNRFTKINNITKFYKSKDFEITDTTFNDANHIIYSLTQYYKEGKPSLVAEINATEKRFLQLTKYLPNNQEAPSYYRAIFSDYIDSGLPTRLEMRISNEVYQSVLKSDEKGVCVESSLTLHRKVKTPIDTETLPQNDKSMFNVKASPELKKKIYN